MAERRSKSEAQRVGHRTLCRNDVTQEPVVARPAASRCLLREVFELLLPSRGPGPHLLASFGGGRGLNTRNIASTRTFIRRRQLVEWPLVVGHRAERNQQ